MGFLKAVFLVKPAVYFALYLLSFQVEFRSNMDILRDAAVFVNRSRLYGKTSCQSFWSTSFCPPFCSIKITSQFTSASRLNTNKRTLIMYVIIKYACMLIRIKQDNHLTVDMFKVFASLLFSIIFAKS